MRKAAPLPVSAVPSVLTFNNRADAEQHAEHCAQFLNTTVHVVHVWGDHRYTYQPLAESAIPEKHRAHIVRTFTPPADEPREHIDAVTIAHCTSCVSYEGTDVHGWHFTHTTYDRPDEFDWSEVPSDTPVIDCAAEDWDIVWSFIEGPPLSGSARVEKARSLGFPVYQAAAYAAGHYPHHRSVSDYR